MAYLTKDDYFRREQAAARRMQRNAENPALTEAQHDALATLCAVRHELHSTPRVGDVLFNEEDPGYSRLWAILETENQTNEVLTALTEAGLPAMDWTCDGVEYDSMLMWKEVYGTEATEDEIEDAVMGLYDLARAFNDTCEAYLRGIDNKYGTNYAPTGALRK